MTSTAAIARALAGDRRALARLLSRVERDDEVSQTLLAQIYPLTGHALRIGITGPPGAGKSSLIARLIATYSAAGRRVAVIAVDPTSPITGGATLGDRIRLGEFHDDQSVYIRSMASRGHRGGVAATTASLGHVFDAAGFDPILVETLGVGQDEVDVAHLVHTVVVLQVPGLGDTVQTLKAGLLEVADILVVNKSDQQGADRLVRDLASMLSLGVRNDRPRWSPPIVRTCASSGDGVDDLIGALDAHHAHLVATGEFQARVNAMAAAEIALNIRREIDRRLGGSSSGKDWSDLVAAVAERELSPRDAAHRVIDRR
jgi:LAO/AO transport system kinase